MKINLTIRLFYIRKWLLIPIMRTFIFLFCTSIFSFTPNNVCSQNVRIIVSEDTLLSVNEVFDIIDRQTDYKFLYHADLFKNVPKVRLKKGTILANRLLQLSLASGNFSNVLTKNNTIVIKPKGQQVQRLISGTVSDNLGVPMSGATVIIKGTGTGTTTDFNGNYSLAVPDAQNVLIFSFLGFANQEIIVGNKTTINVTLKEELSKLDEVTINAGYYTVSERERTGNISKIEAHTIEKQPVANPLAAMQGHMSGVNIVQTSGVPGSGFDIQVRGKNFISGDSDPLYVVDGVPYGSESLGTQAVAGSVIFAGNISPLNAISMGNIESIEVLKDGDATAIYGSRGANGVVLITTKKGNQGKTKVAVNANSSIGQVTRFIDLMNTEQYLEMRKEALINDGLDPIPSAFESAFPDVVVWNQNRYTDWQEELIGGMAFRNSSQLSFSGGGSQTQFLLSGAYQAETTVFPGDSKYGKASIHTNINHQSDDDKLRLNFSATYVSEDNQLPANDFSYLANTLAPNAPSLYDQDGNLNWENSTWNNPLAQLENDYHGQVSNLMANTVIAYCPLPGLMVKANLGFTDYQLEDYRTSPHTQYNPAWGLDSQASSNLFNNGRRQSWILEPQLNWHQKWGKSRLTILMGATFQQQKSKQLAQTAAGFSSNSLILNLAAAANIFDVQYQSTTYNYQSVFGRVNFKWNDRYILNLTGRRDGSSRFGPNRQFGNFGAIGTAWLFSEEAFFSEVKHLSFGKLRASYGTSGSDNIGDYKFLNTYGTTGTNYNGITGLSPTGLYNPDFRWEENKKLEVALELGFWEDRMFLSTAWYQNRSSNQLIGIPLPATTGFSSLNANFDATVENTGFEVDLNAVNLKNKNFKWTTTLNLSIPKNKLLKFDGLESSTFANTLVLGEPLNIRKLYHSLGVDQQTGIYQFEDFNNDGVINSPNDRQIIARLDPKLYGGLGNTLNYGKFQLDVFFQFKKQNASNYLNNGANAGAGVTNRPVYFHDRWQKLGDISSVQRHSVGFNSSARSGAVLQRSSNLVVSDASFIRLRNVSLSYTLPKAVTKGVDCSVYLQGQNLFVITGYKGADPEQQSFGILPPLQQLTLGLNLSF